MFPLLQCGCSRTNTQSPDSVWSCLVPQVNTPVVTLVNNPVGSSWNGTLGGEQPVRPWPGSDCNLA